MECENIRKNLLAYIKQEVVCTTAQQIDQHLDKCLQCQQEQRDIRQHLHLYRQLDTPNCSPKFTQLMHRITEKKPQKRFAIFSYRTVATAMLLFVFLCGSYVLVPSEWNITPIHGPLVDGQFLSTSLSNTATYRFNKNIIITLGSNSKLKINSFPYLQLVQGEIFVKARPRSELTVLAPTGNVSIKGTVFSLSTLPNTNVLNVFRGKVLFHNDRGKILVSEGQCLTDSTKMQCKKILSATPIWWRNNSLAIYLDYTRSGHQHFLNVCLYNNTSQQLSIAPFAVTTPNLLLHIKSNNKNYSTPLRTYLQTSHVSPITIAPGHIHRYRCNISALIKDKQRYSFRVSYQGGNRGLVTSLPLKLNIR